MTWDNLSTILQSAVGGSAVTAVAQFGINRSRRRKLDSESTENAADAAKAIAEAAKTLINPYQQELVRLREELAEARTQIAGLQAEMHVLRRDLAEAHIKLSRQAT